jgi:TolB protein
LYTGGSFAQIPLLLSLASGRFMMLPGSPSNPTPPHNPFSRVFNHAGVVALAVVLVLVGYLAWPLLQVQVRAGNEIQPELKAILPGMATRVPKPTATSFAKLSIPTEVASPTEDAPRIESPLNQGVFILSLEEGGYSHLFAYHPLYLPFTRLTDGQWDDITPAISPDQTRLAFASNRDGPWDLYLLDLASGSVTRLTDTPEYDGAPSWSPDGQFLTYETYTGNLEVYIRPVSGDQPPIPLSEHPVADFSPSWSPLGRQVAFISTRSGEREVWLANLDEPGPEKFTNLSRQPNSAEAHPVWSPSGSLAWAAIENGARNLYIWDGSGEPRLAGSGDWPAWNPDGNTLLTYLLTPDQAMLAAYSAVDGALVLPPVTLPGPLDGLAWLSSDLPAPLAEPLAQAASATPLALWQPSLSPLPDIPSGRHHLVPLYEVVAPYPQLHDMVDESFQALRARLASEAGWDFLVTLENAFVPLTAPLPPGMGEDWLYTGRAFAFSSLPADAGWLVVIPEEFGGQTYWQVYARARFQDGSQGRPLFDLPWDFNARYTGDLLFYQQGGALSGHIPVGYWVNVTRLASAYGWERLPALTTWRAAYPAARFNEFVLSGDQEWHDAMLELYPAEALVTPTPFVPPTLTPTPIPAWLQNSSASATDMPPGLPTLPTPSP